MKTKEDKKDPPVQLFVVKLETSEEGILQKLTEKQIFSKGIPFIKNPIFLMVVHDKEHLEKTLKEHAKYELIEQRECPIEQVGMEIQKILKHSLKILL